MRPGKVQVLFHRYICWNSTESPSTNSYTLRKLPRCIQHHGGTLKSTHITHERHCPISTQLSSIVTSFQHIILPVHYLALSLHTILALISIYRPPVIDVQAC
ncbi:uncharacterized protein YALI1_C31308g [Yarrowia lipolytica]|uniref:Uncharacterized protein n=1 Tax=Yarrowia lipolytica TaxID=4952 RepID=A0A1D8NCB3_YARLL|nr:hypothetical protein YALI1_C31308g [Yarrowia lipolytica]